ncbi:uncharacterized protein TrAtP1_002193 [Trichoderma atroviride]|uniref:uncharacterized protein n=1 Tax=Hypocrea atroviridis TaxID=63577 RepID=UPI00332DCED7|nr:hypothetical protein TrAtP1_002193 [Trichoderma atroviride]
MKLSTSFLAIGLFTGVSIAQNSTVQVAHVTLRSEGDDHSFPMSVPADGKPVFTYSTLPACVIDTVGPANLSSTIASDGVTQQVVIDPPQTVTSITCQGTCVETWSACFDDATGQSLGPCCNGLCIANRCRPFNQP